MKLEPGFFYGVQSRYKLIKLIGVGGFSEVWLAEDIMAGNMQVAIKIYARETGLDEDAIHQFSLEYSRIFKLNHPNILKALHYDVWEGRPYLILQYCAKGSLQKAISQAKSNHTPGQVLFSEERVRKIIFQIASALEILHQEGVVHRDLKPANILIDDHDNYLLTDFGISSRLKSSMSRVNSNSSSGTPAYAAPEVFVRQAEHASDIFSLGVCVYEMCTGDVPWQGYGGVVLSANSPEAELPAVYSRQLEQLMRECLRFDSAKRPTAAEIMKRTGSGYSNQSQKDRDDHGDHKKTRTMNGNRNQYGTESSWASENKRSANGGSRPNSQFRYILIGVCVLMLLLLAFGFFFNSRKLNTQADVAIKTLIDTAVKASAGADTSKRHAWLPSTSDSTLTNQACTVSFTADEDCELKLNDQFAASLKKGEVFQKNLGRGKYHYRAIHNKAVQSGSFKIESSDQASLKINIQFENIGSKMNPLPSEPVTSDQPAVRDEWNTVKIGTQIWMSDHLDVDHYRNGDIIPQAKTGEEWKKYVEQHVGCWCYPGFNPHYNTFKFGKLYNGYAVSDSRGLAPRGWVIPDDRDWEALISYLGGSDAAGSKMKAKDRWDGSNSSGFNGLPSGWCDGNGNIPCNFACCFLWSSTKPDDGNGHYILLYAGTDKVSEIRTWPKNVGLSVRCIKPGTTPKNAMEPGTIKIGGQTWMAHHLSVTHYRNGEAIPEAKTVDEWKDYAAKGIGCFAHVELNPGINGDYGLTYNGFAVKDPRGLAPVGWHIPSDQDWTTLFTYLGGTDVACGKMKSTAGWGYNGNGTNSSGFDAHPAGWCDGGATFQCSNACCFLWSSTEEDKSNEHYILLYFNANAVSEFRTWPKSFGMTVRCVK